MNPALPLLLAAVSLHAPNPVSRAPETTPRGLGIRIHRSTTPEGAPLVEVLLSIPAGTDGSTELRVTPEWGGVTAGGQDLLGFEASTEAGEPLTLHTIDGTSWSVEHGDLERLHLRYLIPANEHQSDPGPETNRRPIVNERIFHSVGELFLVTPRHIDGDDLGEHSIEWTGFDESAGLASSFGAGPGPYSFESTFNQLRHSIFLGGDVELSVHEVWGSPLWVAVQRDNWAFELEELTALAASIVDLQRAFFEDFDRPHYLISMIPVGSASPGSLSFGGTGLTNSFSLAVQPGFDLQVGGFGYGKMSSLLAHELFHDWNGVILQRVDPEQLCYWFSEGFTEYYTRRFLLRGGMIDLDGYVSALNESLREYYASPVRDVRNERVLEDFWTDNFIQKLPYRRGDVVAMILDHALRVHSGGERSLDDLMRELVERGREGWQVSNEELFEIIERQTSSEVVATLRAIVIDGELPVLDPEIFAPCLALRMVEIPQYDIGFDIDASLAEKTARGVREDGPAFAAGLREGDALGGWSYNRGDTTQPVSFQVETESGLREVSFRPVSGSILAPQFEPDESAADACEML